jgi:RimJ/RimL family protein N-acetyltransferase
MSEPLPIPVLTGRTVLLRPHAEADLDPVLERCVHPDTVRWTTVPSPYTREMAQEYLGGIMSPSPEQVSWAIETDGRYGGTLDLRLWGTDLARPSGNLGFVTHPDVRGRGVMSEAIGLAVGHAFDTLGWEHVTWQANAGNYGSCKAAWRNGFPVPQLVTALLKHRGRMVDGWHSVLEPDMPREPQGSWDEAYAVLQAHVRTARRPG